MERVTIKDIAEQLGLSTATVSNVIHGKTKKISDTTVKKVQEQLELSGYIPNMAAVLLAQNSSKIVCVALSNDCRYEGNMITDPFVSGMLNGLSKELEQHGYFMMLKEEADVDAIVKYASMWNMAGIIMIGYCTMDYEKLRSRIHIPLVVIDAYQKVKHNYSDVGIDNILGGYIAGQYLLENGHRKMLYLSDNDEECDGDRFIGMKKAISEYNQQQEEAVADFVWLSKKEKERQKDYQKIADRIKGSDYTAAFCASDVYAIAFMNCLLDAGIHVPEQFSVMGFDDIPLAACVRPALTTISQNVRQRAKAAVELLEELIENPDSGRTILLPVELVKRQSVKNRNGNIHK